MAKQSGPPTILDGHGLDSSGLDGHALDDNGLTPSRYARLLLDSLGLYSVDIGNDDRRPAPELWAQSGAMWLSGRADGPSLACPAPLAACAQGAWLALCGLCPERLDPRFDAFRLLGERAAIAGLRRAGRRSAGGACRLLDTADGTIALNLARDDDSALLPAWLERSTVDEAALPAILRDYSMAALVERARWLGLAVAAVVPPRPATRWFRATRCAGARPPRRTPLVIDLSALWAGPLCAQLLAQCGARVIKVESTARPDGARSGPAAFYHLMNAGKESVALDLRSDRGRRDLLALLRRADIIIESSRPRGLAQMGIRAAELLGAGCGQVWVSITGYGRRDPMADWIAYGDDAGVAAGLSWLMGGDGGDPVFCGDAIADPLTGLHAVLLALARWRAGGGELLDIALAPVVSWCIGAGGDYRSRGAVEAAAPVARPVVAEAVESGVDTARVLKEFL